MAKRKSANLDAPIWFDGTNINEALFCDEFLSSRKIIFFKFTESQRTRATREAVKRDNNNVFDMNKNEPVCVELDFWVWFSIFCLHFTDGTVIFCRACY